MERTEEREGASLDEDTPAPPSRNRAIITVGLMLGMLITAMESTVVSTAMPTVIGDLHGINLYSWVFSAYLLASTTTVPIYGKLADLYGRRKIFLFATALFLLGSMLSGAAQTMPQLIAFRALQGLGAGGVLPLTLTIIGDLYSLEERARVQALFTTMWGLASLAGPLLGAEITTHWSWRLVFYVNLPVGLISSILVGGFLRETKSETAGAVRLDVAGLVLLTGSVMALLFGLLRLGTGAGLASPLTAGLFVAALGLLFAFLRQERRAEDPMLPLDLFTNPIIAAATVGNVLIGLMMYSVDTYMPLFMQGVRGGDAHSAGLVLTPLVLCWSLGAFVGGRALVRFGFRAVASFGVTTIATAAVALGFMTPTTPTFFIVATMIVLGCGMGPSSMTFLVAAQNAVSYRQRGVVTAASQFFRMITGTIGVSALGALLSARMAHTLAGMAAGHVQPDDMLNARARAALPPSTLHMAQQALAGGLHLVFLVIAAIAVTAFLLIARMGRWDGVEVPEEPHAEQALG